MHFQDSQFNLAQSAHERPQIHHNRDSPPRTNEKREANNSKESSTVQQLKSDEKWKFENWLA